jgi:hypothetical protein
MHGRSCAGLTGVLLLSGLLLGQSIAPQQDVSSGAARPAPRTEFAVPNRRTIGARDSQPAVVAVPGLPRSPLQPPIRRRVPWGGPVSLPPSAFARLAQKAGIIFSGTVTNVEHDPANAPGQAVGTVAITFHVETAIRGATPGKSLTITQWVGLWSSGQRYRVGERLLLLLYPPSRFGLTSCVASGMGRFSVDSSGSILLSPQQVLAFRTDPVLGGRSRLRLSDFASAVRWAGEEE